MIFMSNGLYKSGSTWLFILLRKNYGSDIKSIHSSPNNPYNMDLRYLDVYLQEYSENPDKHIVIKAHIYDKNYLQELQNKGIIILYTHRNFVDIIESHHHHFCNEKGIKLSFFLYLLTIGFVKCLELKVFDYIINKHHLYKFQVSFEELQTDNGKAILQKINHTFDFEQCNREIDKVCKESFATGNNNLETEVGGINRSWFFSRSQLRISRLNKFILTIILAITNLARNPFVCKLLVWVFYKVPNRRHF